MRASSLPNPFLRCFPAQNKDPLIILIITYFQLPRLTPRDYNLLQRNIAVYLFVTASNWQFCVVQKHVHYFVFSTSLSLYLSRSLKIWDTGTGPEAPAANSTRVRTRWKLLQIPGNWHRAGPGIICPCYSDFSLLCCPWELLLAPSSLEDGEKRRQALPTAATKPGEWLDSPRDPSDKVFVPSEAPRHRSNKAVYLA